MEIVYSCKYFSACEALEFLIILFVVEVIVISEHYKLSDVLQSLTKDVHQSKRWNILTSATSK